MYKLNYKKREWIVKQYSKGVPTKYIASAQKVSTRTIQNLVKIYRKEGLDGLKDHKTGRPETVLNNNAQILILDIRKRYGYGACHIEQILKQKGFKISHRQIEKVLLRNDLVIPNIKKQKCRKWVRYELPHPNDLWHTDWTHCPFTDKNFSVCIDDRTRLITSFCICRSANAKNSIELVKEGILNYGKPKAIMTDHGSTYYATKLDKKGQNNSQFRIYLQVSGIKHVLARVNRPQTNGKVERFFGTYKREFITETFTNVKDFINYYNNERIHMSLSYKTPKCVWNELVS